jgi:23S rRNA G2445 N2-methylase RlmL
MKSLKWLEVQVGEGLEALAEQELLELLGFSSRPRPVSGGFLLPREALSQVMRSRLAQCLFLGTTFRVPRPKALLGHEHFTVLLSEISSLLRHPSMKGVKTFRLNAAGRDSSVLNRLCDALEKETSLSHETEDGELLIRLRKSTSIKDAWDVLLRVGKRPLSTRPWRVENYRGAVDANVAAAMVRLSKPKDSDRVLDPCCGSGTLLIERALSCSSEEICGVDNNPEALELARRNAEAAKLGNSLGLESGDALELNYKSDSFNLIMSNLPWGENHGDRKKLSDFYFQLLSEALRVGTSDLRCIFLTQAVSAFKSVLESFSGALLLESSLKVYQGGYHPRIFILRKSVN